MKLIFASDIHGSLYYTNLLIDKFNQEKANKLILLGDFLYHGPRNPLPKDYNPQEVANVLNKFKERIIGIRGNCDSEVDQMVLEFPISTLYTQVFVDNYLFFLTHGHCYTENDLPQANHTIFTYGHIHVPVLERKHVIILNPGSISLPKNNNLPTYAIYDKGMISIKTFTGEVVKQLKL